MRHHYVPEFLLRPWAETASSEQGAKVQVFRLDLSTLRSDRHSTKYTAYEDDLYALSVDLVAGMKKQAVETRYLRHVDTLAAKVRQKLESRGLKSLTRDDLMNWVRFLMSLRLRQPNVVLRLRNETPNYLRETLATDAEEYESLRHDENPQTLEEWTEQRYPGLIENFGISFFPELIEDLRIGNILFKMRWWIRDFSNVKRDLLLADHPCILQRVSMVLTW